MSRRQFDRRLLAPLFLILLLPAFLQAAAPPSSDEHKKQLERGRRIYLEGTSPSGGEITAVMSDASVEVPASAVPCGGCHGRDGKGRPEGGIAPSDLTWASLTKPYGVTSPSGRKHPSYDAKLLKRAIALGLDPAGNPLHVAMPRFRMSLKDMDDLLAYLQQLGTETDPGVGGASLRVGVVLPPAGPLTGMGNAVRSVLTARFDALNKEGGIYGRQVEPRFLEAPGSPEQRRSWTSDFLQREEIFASVASFIAGADAELANLFQEKKIPLVGPFTVHPRETFPLNRYVFYLLPGGEIQGQALARFIRARDGAKPAKAAIVAPDDPGLNVTVEAVRKAAAAAGWPPPAVERYGRQGLAPAAIARLTELDPVFFFGSGAEARAFLVAADGLGWRPRLLATGAAADDSLFGAPAAFDGRIFLALPSLPGDPAPQAAAAYRALAKTYKLPQDSLSAQLSALAAAEALIEALKRAGRDVSREKIVDQLESLRAFQTGFVPPLTYGSARRLGARGAYVMRLDLKEKRLVPEGGWVEVE
jgi:ABC-type branched-subunit amino acid transport system substrate-binding protein